MKYLLLSLLLLTQLFADDKNKIVTVYGYVSEQVVHSSITNKKENYYILDAYQIDGKGVANMPLQLVYDSNKTHISTASDRLQKKYKIKGVILESKRRFNLPITKSLPITQYKLKVNSIETLNGKMKAITYLDDYSKVKLMVPSPMIGKEEAKLQKIDINYVRNVKVKADNTILYNADISPCLTENPLLKFDYKNIKPLSLTLEYTDSNGTTRSNTTRVNQKNKTHKIVQLPKLLKNSKSYPNQIESIKKLFGDITLIEDGIQLTAPKLAENGGNVPINIRSDIKFKSIALFIKSGNGQSNYSSNNSDLGCGEGHEFSLVSQWFGTLYSITNLDIRVTITMRVGTVIVILEAENGKFYTAKQEVDVSLGGAGP